MTLHLQGVDLNCHSKFGSNEECIKDNLITPFNAIAHHFSFNVIIKVSDISFPGVIGRLKNIFSVDNISIPL
jgi:hypothetical protein